MMPLYTFHTILNSNNTMLIYSTPNLAEVPSSHQLHYPDMVSMRMPARSLDDLSRDIMRQFLHPITIQQMLSMSASMTREYKRKLQDGVDCMLPSYCHTLPTGQETGTYLALDVGGSTLRVALVELNGRFSGPAPLRIRRMTMAPIDNVVRKLPSVQFFDWMAARIKAMLAEEPDVVDKSESPLPLGLAWSFPIDQTSMRAGKVLGMGKGFTGHGDTVGMDLGELIVDACQRQNVRVRIDAILNDSSATLLSQAYLEHSTSMGLIVGTGANAAVHLPTSCVGRSKFGVREASWFARADRVITNTELSMFGKDILPETRWDESLNASHPRPDFQPLEYMTTGRYLGEILRLIIVEAVETANLFGGEVPAVLLEPYSLDTVVLARLESDLSATLTASIFMLQQAFQLSITPTKQEASFLRTASHAISHRAAAYLAIAIHALWSLQKETEINPTTPHGTPKTSIACNGSVILKYPSFMSTCQEYLIEMIKTASGAGGLFTVEAVCLEPTDEAAILGAAVAVALAREE